MRGVDAVQADRLRQERRGALTALWLAKRLGYRVKAAGRVRLCYSELDLGVLEQCRNWDDWVSFVDRLSEAQAFLVCMVLEIEQCSR